MFRQTKTCPGCGSQIEKRASFCPQCGGAQPDAGGRVRCGSCGADVPVTARFCPNCRARMDMVQPPHLGDNRWQRGSDDFATHIVVDDVRGLFSRNLIVEPGTQAIILADGANAGIVGPGSYKLDDLIERGTVTLQVRGAHRVEIILIDTADSELDFTITGIYTQDPLEVKVDVVVAAQVANPMRFYQTLMRSSRSYPLHDLRDYLYGEVEDATREWLSAYSAKDLNTNLRVKDDLETAIQAHLQRTEDRNGLRIVRVRALDLAHPYIDRVTQQEAELFIVSAEAEVAFKAERARLSRERVARQLATEDEVAQQEDALSRRKALFAIYDDDQVQDLYEESRKVQMHEGRAKLWEQMRQSVLGDKMAELRGEREMETFLRGLDQERLLEEDEWQQLQQTLRENQDDHVSLRAHLLAKTQMERDYELRQIEFLQRTDLQDAELDWEIQHARRELEGKQKLDQQHWEYELQKRERQAESDRQQREIEAKQQREQALQDELARLESQKRNAQTQAEIARIEREEDRLDLELGAMALERMKAIRRQDEAERRLSAIEARRLESEIELHEEERRLRLRLEQERQEHEREIAMAKLHLDAEAKRSEQQVQIETTRTMAEVRQIEALHGLSDKQVESIMAAKSADYARSLADQARAAADGKLNEDQLRLFEQEKARLRAEANEMRKEAREERMEQGKHEHEAQMKLIETMGETVRAQAQATHGATVMITPGIGMGGVTQVGGAVPPGTVMGQGGATIVCQRCHLQSPAGTKFCQNCGYDFFATAPTGTTP